MVLSPYTYFRQIIMMSVDCGSWLAYSGYKAKQLDLHLTTYERKIIYIYERLSSKIIFLPLVIHFVSR